jgi:hypothetical protein
VLITFVSLSLVLDSLMAIKAQHWCPSFVSLREHP